MLNPRRAGSPEANKDDPFSLKPISRSDGAITGRAGLFQSRYQSDKGIVAMDRWCDEPNRRRGTAVDMLNARSGASCHNSKWSQRVHFFQHWRALAPIDPVFQPRRACALETKD